MRRLIFRAVFVPVILAVLGLYGRTRRKDFGKLDWNGQVSSQGDTRRRIDGARVGEPTPAALPPPHRPGNDPDADERPFDPEESRDRLPDRIPGQSPTSGLFYGEHGGETSLVSGTDDSTPSITAGLHETGMFPPNGTPFIANHVEMKAAQEMWSREIADAHLVINHADGPCPDIMGCDSALPAALPPGSRLTVHWRDTEGNMRWEAYEAGVYPE